MRSILVGLTALALATSAAAQTMDADAARAKARAMISKVWADAAFAAEAWENGPLVRHRRTGLVCRFNNDQRDSVDVYEGEKFSMVGCTMHAQDATIYAYGNPPAGGLDQVSIAAEGSLRKAFANLEALPASPVAPPSAGMPPIAVSSFTGEKDGRRWYVQLVSMDFDRWSFSQRAVGPMEKRAEIDRLGLAAAVQQAKDAGYTGP
jgi:hypothetical protein